MLVKPPLTSAGRVQDSRPVKTKASACGTTGSVKQTGLAAAGGLDSGSFGRGIPHRSSYHGLGRC